MNIPFTIAIAMYFLITGIYAKHFFDRDKKLQADINIIPYTEYWPIFSEIRYIHIFMMFLYHLVIALFWPFRLTSFVLYRVLRKFWHKNDPQVEF